MLEFLFKQIYRYRQIIRYIISGGTATMADLILLYLFTDVFGIWYLFSAILAFCLSFFVSFFLQKYWTFRDREQEKIYRQMGLYLAVAVTNLGLNTLLMFLLVDILGIWYLLAQVLVISVIAVESFLIYKFLIFNRPTRSAPVLPDSKNNLKILIATGIYPPDFRGPATLLETLPHDLVQRGFEIKVITYSDVPASEGEKDFVYRVQRSRPALVRYLIYFWQLYKLNEWADAIFVTDTYSVGYFVYLIKKLTGKKYILRFVGDSAWETAVARNWTNDYIVDFQNKIYGRQIERLKKRRQKILVSADKIIAVSNFIADIAKRIGASDDKIKVVYNSIDFVEARDIDLEAVRNIKNHYGQNSKIIVTACQLMPWKGVDGLIKILPALEKKIGSLSLLVLGEGQELNNLRQLANKLGVAPFVYFLGKIERKHIFNYFKAADLFILNTNYEALSYTLLEVMAASTPIITTNIGGNPEVIENGKNGFLVDYNSEEQLFEAAVKIFNDPQLSKNFTAAGKEKLKRFSAEENLNQTVKILKSIL
jgi:glycosyltransferase involved in cell wall biosynthesis/putative flippase GtrA